MDFIRLPQLPIASLTTKPISKTVTNTAAGLFSAASKDVKCVGVWLQSSAKDDSNGAMSGVMYVVEEETPGAGFSVLCDELVTGQETFIPCTNTSQIKVKTQTGTAWVRGFAVIVEN